MGKTVVVGAILIAVALVASSILAVGPSLLGTGGRVEGAERIDVSVIEEQSLPYIGDASSRYRVYVFYDFLCPFCAEDLNESIDDLEEYASKGVKVVFVDFPTHEASVPIHSIARCVYKERGTGEFLELLKGIYALYMATGNPPTMLDVLTVMNELGIDYPDQTCVDNVRWDISGQAYRLLTELGIRGTPTYIFYDAETGKGFVMIGAIGPETLRNSIETLMKGIE